MRAGGGVCVGVADGASVASGPETIEHRVALSVGLAGWPAPGYGAGSPKRHGLPHHGAGGPFLIIALTRHRPHSSAVQDIFDYGCSIPYSWVRYLYHHCL